jgi:hypothetical protein
MKEIARLRKGQAKASSDTARFAILSLIHQATWKGFLGARIQQIVSKPYNFTVIEHMMAWSSVLPNHRCGGTPPFKKTRIDCGSQDYYRML